jgi:hypothetical protein
MIDIIKDILNVITDPLFTAILGILGFVLAIVGIIYAFVLYKRALRDPQPCFKSTSLQIMPESDTLEGITVNYNGKRVERVTLTALAFWNAGRGTLKGDQIASEDPLKIVLTGRVLEVEIIKRTNNANSFSVTRARNNSMALNCTFDYLNSQDGVTIQILHTGSAEVSVLGSFHNVSGVHNKGVTEGINGLIGFSDDEFKSFLLVLLGAYSSFHAYFTCGPNSDLVFLSFGFIYVFISKFDRLFKTQLNQSWYKHVPKSLRFFGDD